ncbi:MAG TPA: mannose-6-phosphate isomerase [Phycisphaerales bacterium]|nr:mannose-6-phosphate isomerase [Phycisphaerales bacterium]
MGLYPLKFTPIYKEKIWGGRSLERLFGRRLPPGAKVGESWNLADLAEGASAVSNGPLEGTTLTELTAREGANLLGAARPLDNGRFPLLLKLLDANDILSLQVHPDERAAAEIPGAALKTECWTILESRGGFIYKGVCPGVTAEQFRHAIETDTVEQYVRRIECRDGDFHYLPAGLVHAIGPGLVVAEVQTPSDTTYRVTDWGRGREIHVERSMQCIRFELTGDEPPGAAGETLLVTPYFTVARRIARAGSPAVLPPGRCIAVMLLNGEAEIIHSGQDEAIVPAGAGDTVLFPAELQFADLNPRRDCTYLEITLPEGA